MQRFRITLQFDPEAEYIGATVSYDPLPGEQHRRGNDLSDGKWTDETMAQIWAEVRALYEGEGDFSLVAALRARGSC